MRLIPAEFMAAPQLLQKRIKTTKSACFCWIGAPSKFDVYRYSIYFRAELPVSVNRTERGANMVTKKSRSSYNQLLAVGEFVLDNEKSAQTPTLCCCSLASGGFRPAESDSDRSFSGCAQLKVKT